MSFCKSENWVGEVREFNRTNLSGNLLVEDTVFWVRCPHTVRQALL